MERTRSRFGPARDLELLGTTLNLLDSAPMSHFIQQPLLDRTRSPAIHSRPQLSLFQRLETLMCVLDGPPQLLEGLLLGPFAELHDDIEAMTDGHSGEFRTAVANKPRQSHDGMTDVILTFAAPGDILLAAGDGPCFAEVLSHT